MPTLKAHWLKRIILRCKCSSLLCTFLIICCTLTLMSQISLANNELENNSSNQKFDQYLTSSDNVDQSTTSNKDLPTNHRIESLSSLVNDKENTSSEPTSSSNNSNNNNNNSKMSKGLRQSRQYDSSISASSTGNSYAALSGDGAAYVAQMPLTSPNYGATSHSPSGSSSSAQYANELLNNAAGLGSAYGHSNMPNAYLHDPLSIARGYPMAPPVGLPSMHHHSQLNPLASPFSGPLGGGAGGGLFSASSMFPLVSKGFDLSEIVCTAIAVAIGAVIIGAPFILIYLFVMNQMQTNGPNAMGPNGGAISLTGPSSQTTVNGRKKRQTGFPEALFKQLSPLVNNEQVASTFKALMSSISKYQM